MSEHYQNFLRKSREFIAPLLIFPLSLGVATDIWSHPNTNTKQEFWSHILEGNKADATRRHLIESIPSIGPVIANHIGNFGNSAAMMIPFTAAGYAIKEYGKSIDSKTIETIGKLTPLIGFLAIVAINLIVENLRSENTQMIGDLIFGIGGAILSNVTTQGAIERFQTKRNEHLGVVVS